MYYLIANYRTIALVGQYLILYIFFSSKTIRVVLQIYLSIVST